MQLRNDIDWSQIEGVFTDVDDTLTQHGKLEANTYAALWALKKAGIKVVPVTGRSAGWAHMMMMQWPVDAVIAESGACWFKRDEVVGSEQGRIRIHFFDKSAQLGRAELVKLCSQLIAQNSPLQFALDNDFRLVDVAIDYNEEVKVSELVVQEVIESIRAQGYQARASSIHINAWLGQFDKAPAAIKLLETEFASQADMNKWVFIGDAPNDESMFAVFPNSVGVANIQDSIEHRLLKHHPKMITQASFGQGFVEMAQQLLKSKRQ